MRPADPGRAGLTPGVERWLRHLAERGPSKRWHGPTARRAYLAGYTDWWVRDRKTGATMARSDAPNPYRTADYDVIGEGITPAGRRALDEAREGRDGR